MNYRHAFHAGNFADVVKHVCLCLILDHLRRKETPFFVLDTHAGAGCYDLAGPQAAKTGEWSRGVGRVADGAPLPGTESWLAAVAAVNPGGGLRFYPGSPRITRALMRPGDRLALAELHPEDARALADDFAGDPQVRVHAMDGYGALKALLPPPERRGLVLVDPPFEEKDEFRRMETGLRQALRRWATGTYALWYPIKGWDPIDGFHARIAELATPRPVLAVDYLMRPADQPVWLNGCGLVIVNPPWHLDTALAALLPALVQRMGHDKGEGRLTWLVPPS